MLNKIYLSIYLSSRKKYDFPTLLRLLYVQSGEYAGFNNVFFVSIHEVTLNKTK